MCAQKSQNEQQKKNSHIKIVLTELLSSQGLNANSLATLLNFPTPTIQRLLTGEVQDPRCSTLVEIADHFGISVDQLLGRKPLGKKFQEQLKHSSNFRPPHSIPVFSLSEACNRDQESKTPSDWLKWQVQSEADSSQFGQLFAVRIKNNVYEPIFVRGTFIIIDPVTTPQNGAYVLVKFLNDAMPVIKKYISEGNQKYLYSLQPEVKPVDFEPKKCIILGSIIESYLNFRFMEM